jgi:hypothetical protein
MKKMPRMDTFALPVSPSHVVTAAGIAITQLIPGIRPEPRGIITAAVVGVYILGETAYACVRAKKIEMPEQLRILSAKASRLEQELER